MLQAPDIEIIPHCWQYHRLLTVQLSGFVLWPPTCRVLYRPCVTSEDRPTMETLLWFAARLPLTVTMEPHVMDRKRLMRRTIGRNECALTSRAPVVWMADCDYQVQAGDLEAILNAWPEGRKLAHPGRVRCTSPERGMALVQYVTEPMVLPPSLLNDEGLTQRKSAAIGGLQFFDGEHCRKTGYCGPRMRGRCFRPADRWQPTKEDKWARAAAGEDATMPITAFYRVRHTVRSEGANEDAKL